MKTSKFNKGLTVAVFAALFIMFASVIFASSGDNEWKVPDVVKKIKNPTKATIESIANGKALFEQNCATCHGDSGEGDGPGGKYLGKKVADLTSAPVIAQVDGELFYKLTSGRSPMPAFKTSLKAKQRWDLINYIRTLETK